MSDNPIDELGREEEELEAQGEDVLEESEYEDEDELEAAEEEANRAAEEAAKAKDAYDNNHIIPGLGLTRAQVLRFIQQRDDEYSRRPDFFKYLYDIDDWLTEGTLITENTPRMVTTKIRLKIILAALDPARTKPLIQIFLEEYNREMIPLDRQGRQEALGALQLLAAAGGEDRAIGIG